ncbi:3-hydroxybutyrate dehydrogenase [Bacillus carboniphilus]|uniref:3-hydroxybutyrate dehydrogenase n=1 Tax=Bacillus carboniphilus TaxID=86663 RepID=A0ABN0VYE5_9BACI
MSRSVIITGGAQGIGYEIGKEFLKNNDQVLLTDINAKGLEEAKNKLSSEGLHVHTLTCDVTDEEQVAKMFSTAVENFGSVDVLINNAGMQRIYSLEEFPTDTFERMIKLMLVAPFVATKHAFPIMKKQKFGRIINMASINGVIGFPGKAAYNSAKHGVIGLTKVSAIEGAEYGITVNAVCPGYVNTSLVQNQLRDLANTKGVPLEKVLEEVIYPLVPQKRLLETKEIADYVLFLASDRVKGVTGQAVIIDGGYTAQ